MDTTPKPLILQVARKPTSEGGTLGTLTAYVGDAMVYKCYTLEDPVRTEGVKVWGDTAIPQGTYPVKIRFSNRFQKELPGIEGAPGYQGLLIHGGNDKLDTHGCILVGTQLQALAPKPRIGICAPAVSMLVELVRKHPTTITIKDAT
jgi:Family of unknown function (DUF5675)